MAGRRAGIFPSEPLRPSYLAAVPWATSGRCTQRGWAGIPLFVLRARLFDGIKAL